MTTTRSRATAASLFAVALIGVAVAVGGFASGAVSAGDDEAAVLTLIILAFSGTGLALTMRIPDNRIGWIYSVAGVLGGLTLASSVYAEAAIAKGLPGAAYGAVVYRAAYFPWVLTMVALLMLLFPDGRLPSPRWRWVTWVIGTNMAFQVLATVVAPVPVPGFETDLYSPFGVESLEPIYGSPVLFGVASALHLGSLLGPVAALVVRFRRARGVERQQLKWLVLSASIAGLGLLSIYMGELILDPALRTPLTYVALLAVLGIPIATGLAVTRYRLYDIDRLISRTILYGIVVALLVGVYGTGVFVVGTLLPGESDLSVVVSTLAVAALFNPLRRNLRGVIDRRFFRAPYDAREVVEELSARLQGEVDPAAVRDVLLEAVDDTVRPSRSGIWVRGT